MLLVGMAQVGAQTDRNLIRQGNRAFKSQKWAPLYSTDSGSICQRLFS